MKKDALKTLGETFFIVHKRLLTPKDIKRHLKMQLMKI
jgi:hypothetical protein